MTDQLIIRPARPRLSLVPLKPEPPAPEVVHWRDAYRLMEPLARAIPLDELLAVNLDMPSVVTTALAAATGVQELRDQVRRQLPTFDLMSFDRLKTVAQAAGHAHVLWLSSSAPSDNVPALNIKCQAARRRLDDHVISLSAHGVVLRRAYRHWMTSTEGLALSRDLTALARYLRVAWDEVGFEGVRARRDLERAEELADQLLFEAAKRQAAQDDARYENTEQRQRFFTLLVQEYEQVRRAVTFVRWEADDAHKIAPTLFRDIRPRRRRKKDQRN